MSELKPCPLCNGAPILNEWTDVFEIGPEEEPKTLFWAQVGCPTCGAGGPPCEGESNREEAIAAWNSRPREEKAKEALEAAREFLPDPSTKPNSSEPAAHRARRLVEEALAMLGKEEM